MMQSLQTRFHAFAAKPFVVLLFGDRFRVADFEAMCSEFDGVSVEYRHEKSMVGAVGAIVTDQSDLNLIHLDDPDVESLLGEISDFAIHSATYILSPPSANSAKWDRFKKFDHFKYLEISEGLPHQLPILIRLTREKRLAEKRFRAEKDGLIRQLLDLRDEQERVQDQSLKLIEMAEGLEYSKKSLEKLNADKDRLFSVIAHDLSSPFNAILNYSQLLATTSDKLDVEQIKDYANSTHIAATNVFRLLQTLLEWAKLRIGKSDFNPSWCRVTEILAAATDVYALIAENKGLVLECENTEAVVFCDKAMAETVVRNLVNNAIKFTHRGGRVRLYADEEDDFVRISVQDNGIGMTEAQQAAFCEIGSQARGIGTSGETGAGLGLSICRDLIAQNGGQFDVQSRLGQGARVSFTLKRKD